MVDLVEGQAAVDVAEVGSHRERSFSHGPVGTLYFCDRRAGGDGSVVNTRTLHATYLDWIGLEPKRCKESP
jgi:hypothetical protein